MVQPWLPWSIQNGELIHLITLWEISISRSAQKNPFWMEMKFFFVDFVELDIAIFVARKNR